MLTHTEEESQIVKTIDREKFTVSLRSDGIVHIHIRANTLVTVELQREMEVAYSEATDIKRPFIFTGEEFVSVTTEARKNSIKMEMRVPAVGSAMVVRNLAQKILADYYYRFNKPKKPYKVFRRFEDAVEWCKDNFECFPC